MKPDKLHLMRDLLEDNLGESRRQSALLAGRRLLRRKRYTRVASRAFAVLAIVALATLSLQRKSTPLPSTAPTVSAPPSVINSLTDDQLLALFPDTPVGLATIGDKKVLIFPRVADQEQFLGRF